MPHEEEKKRNHGNNIIPKTTKNSERKSNANKNDVSSLRWGDTVTVHRFHNDAYKRPGDVSSIPSPSSVSMCWGLEKEAL